MRKIGRYEIMEKIGEGGMGTVYKAILPTLNRIVALKVLSKQCAEDREFVERFLREARIMAALPDYNHVVQVFDLDRFEDGYFYTMEYIPRSLAHALGETDYLDDRTRRVKPEKQKLTVQAASKVAEHILKGLAVIHAAGIVHRDISPQNVLLVKDNNGFRAKLTDFGIAGTRESGLTQTGMGGIGKQFYCAPEQWEDLKSSDFRSDLYSVGILMYRMVTGKLPVGFRIKQANELNPDVGQKLNEWILTATEQEPVDRFKDAAAMLSGLMDAMSQKGSPPPVDDSEETSAETGRKVVERDRHYEKYDTGVVRDTKTGLEWYAGPDKGMDWNEAKAWVDTLNVDGGGWRMPTTRSELATLYEEGMGSRNMTPLLGTTGWWIESAGWWVWSGEKKGSSSAWDFNCQGGIEGWDFPDGSNVAMVFAVRSR